MAGGGCWYPQLVPQQSTLTNSRHTSIHPNTQPEDFRLQASWHKLISKVISQKKSRWGTGVQIACFLLDHSHNYQNYSQRKHITMHKTLTAFFSLTSFPQQAMLNLIFLQESSWNYTLIWAVQARKIKSERHSKKDSGLLHVARGHSHTMIRPSAPRRILRIDPLPAE